MLLIFGFGIAWCIYHAWAVVYPDNESISDWTDWGWHMTEAGFDTVTALLMVGFYFKLVLNRDFFADVDGLFGNIGMPGWIPFWTTAFLPFAIRLKCALDDETTPVRTKQSGTT